MERYFVSAIALLALAGSASAQFGEVQFRWRERGLGVLPVVGGVQSTNLPAGATLNGANFTGNVATNTDGTFHLILEAFVTSQDSLTKGFQSAAGALVTNAPRSSAAFASSIVGSGTELRNAASAGQAASGYTTGSGIAGPDGFNMTNGNRGVFAPFRGVADSGSSNNAAIGVQNLSTTGGRAGVATLENIAFGVDTAAYYNQVDDGSGNLIDGPVTGQTQYFGLGRWVPVYYAILNINALAGLGASVDTNFEIDGGASGVRVWRGVNNTALASPLDIWPATTSGVPTFRVVIPAPGSVALLGLGGLVAARRRRA